MQDGNDSDSIVCELIEERVWKTAEKNPSKRAMYDTIGKWVPLCQRDCVVDSLDEILAKFM